MTRELVNRPLFRGSASAQIRAVLRSEGWTDEDLNEIDDAELAITLERQRSKIAAHRYYKAALPGWIAQGYVSAEEARTMRGRELMKLGYKMGALERYRDDCAEAKKAVTAQVKPAPPQSIPDLSRAEALTLVAKLVAVIAAQQIQHNELRNQVATLHNAHVAVFGQQKVIEQLTNAARDFEGVDVTMQLEEQSTTSAESTTAASEESQASFESARSMSAAIEGLASVVAGLNAGGAVNLTEMSRAAKTLSETSKTHAKVRNKGEVRIKIGKVTGGRSGGDPQ
jgi:hypothetical protein